MIPTPFFFTPIHNFHPHSHKNIYSPNKTITIPFPTLKKLNLHTTSQISTPITHYSFYKPF
nr:MAG TPA: hypothetical protein [Caudoviricetes sp.]